MHMYTGIPGTYDMYVQSRSKLQAERAGYKQSDVSADDEYASQQDTTYQVRIIAYYIILYRGCNVTHACYRPSLLNAIVKY